MRPNGKTGRVVRSFIIPNESGITEASTRTFKGPPSITRWNVVRVLAMGALMFAATAMYLNMTSEGEVNAGPQNGHLEDLSLAGEPENAAEGAEQIPAYPLEAFWIKAERRAQVDWNNAQDALQERPLQAAGFKIQARQAAQRKLIDLGFATIEGAEFQASVAEADDAGHGKLLLQAGFTEQQIRNAQERQRRALEEAKADAWFRQLASINALTELRRQGMADFQGNINVAAAHGAGFGDLLLRAGITEQQILDAQRR